MTCRARIKRQTTQHQARDKLEKVIIFEDNNIIDKYAIGN